MLGEKLGEGGFGTVYRAEQRTLGRPAVVKVMRASLATRGDAIERFTREARLASRFDHPYAAHVYAFGAEPDGLPWIAMEMVRGTPLDQLIASSGPLALERFIPLMERLCEVIQAAHDQGIVHRDIKPSNVMVIARSGRLVPKLLDFGIAKLIELDELPVAGPGAGGIGSAERDRLGETITSAEPFVAHARRERTQGREADPSVATLSVDHVVVPTSSQLWVGLTREGQVLGSPPYMAPEQWLGASRVGPRSDQYALAMLAYEVLSGRRPYQATTPEELAACHLRVALPPLPPHVPEAIHAVLARAAAKEPTQRFDSLDQLAAALRQAIGQPAEIEEAIELPGELRAMWVADAPRPIAEAIAALAVGGSARRIVDRAAAVASTIAHWLGVLALACRSRIGKLAAGGEEIELLRALRRRPLRDAEWVDLAAGLTRPFADRPAVWPIPEQVTFFASRAAGELRAALAGDAFASDADGERRLAIVRVAQIAALLGELSWLLDYDVAHGVPEGLEIWMGVRSDEAFTRPGSGEDLGRVVVLDGDGARVVALSPAVQICAPARGEPPEMFVLRGPGSSDQMARFIAPPRGFERELDGVWPWLAGGVLEIAPAELGLVPEERPPYPGLAAFTGADHASFVGRERETEELINRLRAQRVIAVVGPSGVGKSSFLAAGVVPGLPERWSAEVIRPGDNPFAALTAMLDRRGERLYRDRLADSRAPSVEQVITRLIALAERHGETLVIVVDQAEELFTICNDPARRTVFAEVLAGLWASPRMRVVLGVRDDFLCRLDELAPWRGLIGRSVQILRMPGRAELERIVTVPARRRGYDFDDPALPRRIVDEVADRPGALPLVAFAAAELWDQRDRHFRRLTRAAYDRIGGVVGALVQHADGVVDGMPAADRRLVRVAFGRLLTAAGTRTILGRDDLIAALAAPGAAKVVERLLEARLIASHDDDAGERVEIIHEALVTTWPRLAAWRRDDAAEIQLHEQLAAAARHWDERGRGAGLLWRGDAVDDLRRWRTRSRLSLTPLEQAFADASEASARQLRRRRRRLIAAAFCALGVALAVLGWFNHRIAGQRAEAVHQVAAGFAERTRLAMLGDDALHGLLYAAEARRLGHDDVALDLLTAHASAAVDSQVGVIATGLGPIWRMELDATTIALVIPGGARLWDRARGELTTAPVPNTLEIALVDGSVVMVSRDGDVSTIDRSGATRWKLAAAPGPRALWERIAVSAPARLVARYSTTAEVWRLDDGAPVAALRSAGPIHAAAFDRAGTRLATGDTTGEIRVWSLPSGALLATCAGHTGRIEQLAFSSDGAMLVSASDDRDVRICDPATGAARQRLQGHTHWVTRIDLSSDGHTIASSSTDGTARLWDARTGTLIATLANLHGVVQQVMFSPDGRHVATAAADGAVRIWDAAGIAVASLEGHAGRVMNLAWEPDGHLITAGFDGSIRRWDLGRALLAASDQRHSTAITDLAVSSDGRWSATGDADGTVVVWDLRAGEQRARLRGAGAIVGIGFAPDGQTLVASDRTGTAWLWSVPDGRLIRRFGEGITAALYAPDGRAIVTGGEDHMVRMWSTGGAQLAQIPIGMTPGEFTVAPGGRWLAFRPAFTETSTDTVVIDLAAARVATRIHGDHAGYATAIDATRIATADGRLIRVWELGTWRPLATLSGHVATCHNLTFLADGRLVSTGDDPKLLLWSTEYALLASLPLAGGHAIYMDATADSSLLATDGDDGAARIWDAHTYRELLTLPSHHQALVRVKLTPDGERLITAGADGRVVTWDLRRPVRSQAELDRLVRCRVPLRLDGDLVLPRDLALDDPSCR